MGHEGVLTTFTSYGEVGRERTGADHQIACRSSSARQNVPGVERYWKLLSLSAASRGQI